MKRRGARTCRGGGGGRERASLWPGPAPLFSESDESRLAGVSRVNTAQASQHNLFLSAALSFCSTDMFPNTHGDAGILSPCGTGEISPSHDDDIPDENL